jgi:type II secretory pathway component PulF
MTVRDCIMQSMQVGITTQGVLRISWMYFSGPILGLLAAIVLTRIFKSNSVRPMFDEFVMRVPGLRSLYGRIALARFFRMLAAYVESGHEVGAGLQAAISAMDNHYYARRLRRAIAFVRAGESFADGLALTGVMDRQALSMIHAGEAVGALPELAPRLADYYETEVRTLLPGLAKASYPAMIILIAVAYFVNPMFLGLGAFLMFFLLFMTV